MNCLAILSLIQIRGTGREKAMESGRRTRKSQLILRTTRLAAAFAPTRSANCTKADANFLNSRAVIGSSNIIMNPFPFPASRQQARPQLGDVLVIGSLSVPSPLDRFGSGSAVCWNERRNATMVREISGQLLRREYLGVFAPSLSSPRSILQFFPTASSLLCRESLLYLVKPCLNKAIINSGMFE